MIRNCADAEAFLARENLALQDHLEQFIAHLKTCGDCRRKFFAALEANLAKTIYVLAAQAARENQEGREGEGVGLLRLVANSL